MGTILMGDKWKCQKCGSAEIRQHCKRWETTPEGKWERFTTKAERDSDPELASRCNRGGPCVWESDPGWHTCEGCGDEIDDDGRKALVVFNQEMAEHLRNGTFVIHEEIGVAIINNYEIAKCEVDMEVK